jgi:hypothetical protein
MPTVLRSIRPLTCHFRVPAHCRRLLRQGGLGLGGAEGVMPRTPLISVRAQHDKVTSTRQGKTARIAEKS